MKSTTFIPLLSLVLAASAKEQRVADQIRRLRLKEALKADIHADDRAQGPEEEEIRMDQVPCEEYFVDEGTDEIEIPDDCTKSPTKSPSRCHTYRYYRF